MGWAPRAKKKKFAGDCRAAGRSLPRFLSGCAVGGLLILPGVHLDTALDEYGSAFSDIFRNQFRRFSPECDVEKGRVGFLLPGVVYVVPVYRQSKINDCRAAWRVSKLGVARAVADDVNGIE